MSTPTRIPAPVLRKPKKIEHTEAVLIYEGVTVLSPRGSRPYWRVKFHCQGRAYEKSGGRTYDSVWCVIEVMSQKLFSLKLQQEDLPEKSFKTVAQMVEAYFANFGPDGDWPERTATDRTSEFKQLIEIGRSVTCDKLTKHHLRRSIATASTVGRAKDLTGVLKTLLQWGSATGYLTDVQAKLAQELKWEKPKDYTPNPNRRDQSKMHDPLPSGAPGGNVPTHSQVAAWATKCGTRYIRGEGLIYADANMSCWCVSSASAPAPLAPLAALVLTHTISCVHRRGATSALTREEREVAKPKPSASLLSGRRIGLITGERTDLSSIQGSKRANQLPFEKLHRVR